MYAHRYVVDLLQIGSLANETQIAQHFGLVRGSTAGSIVYGNVAITVRVIKLVGTWLQVLDQLRERERKQWVKMRKWIGM